MKNKLIALALILTGVFALTACNGNKVQNENSANNNEATSITQNVDESPTIKAIKEKGKLTLGTSADFPPYEFRAIIDSKEEIVGFDIEIAKYLADKLGVELEIKDMDFSLLIGVLKQGQIDMVISGLSYTQERAEQIAMSNPYYTGKQSILIRESDKDKFIDEESVKGATIGVQMGSIQAALAHTIQDANVKELPVIPSLLVDLKTEKIDLIILDSPVAKQYADNNEDLMSPDFTFEGNSDSMVIGVQKESVDLLEFINNELEIMKNDGLIDKFIVDAMELSSEQSK